MKRTLALAIWAPAIWLVVGCAADNPNRVAERVEIQPESVQVEVGEQIKFVANALGGNGEPVGDLTSALFSSDETILRVLDAEGTVEVVGAGVAEVRVAIGDAQAAAAVTVSCPRATGPTNHSGAVLASETWKASGSPHVITNSLTIGPGTNCAADQACPIATVTVESCSVVQVAESAQLTVAAGGALRVEGSSTDLGRVRFEPLATGAASAWPGILFADELSASLSARQLTGQGSLLRGATILRAGGLPAYAGAPQASVVARGTLTHPTEILMENVRVEDSRGYGLVFEEYGGLLGPSNALTVVGAAEAPVIAHPNRAGDLPPGDYLGNARDVIEVRAGKAERTTSWRVRGTPYRLLGDVVVSGDPELEPVLTIGDGLVVEFAEDSGLEVGTVAGESAVLIVGSAFTRRDQVSNLEPALFTAAPVEGRDKAAGQWKGIVIGRYINGARTLFRAAVLEYAGGPSGRRPLDGDFDAPDNAALIMQRPLTATALRALVFRQSAGFAVVRAYADTGRASSHLEDNEVDESTIAEASLESPPNPLRITSDVLVDGRALDGDSLCGTSAQSPQLAWEFSGDRAEEAQGELAELALVVLRYEPGRAEPILHWLVWGIAPREGAVAADASRQGSLPEGAMQAAVFGQECAWQPDSTCSGLKQECEERSAAGSFLDFARTSVACARYRSMCLLRYRFELVGLREAAPELAQATSAAEVAERLADKTASVATTVVFQDR